MILTASVVVRIEAVAQPIHPIPFASTGNAIELTVANNSFIPLSAVKVEAKNAPSWIRFVSSEHLLQQVEAKGEAQALFSFSVEKSAPVNEKQSLLFTITTQTGESWTKEIAIKVDPPDHFELFQNYPNPVNPITTIAFQLPKDARVSLKVYNLLGQEVVTLIDGDVPAGYHQQMWNANTFASGTYVYQLTSIDNKGERRVARHAMVLLK